MTDATAGEGATIRLSVVSDFTYFGSRTRDHTVTHFSLRLLRTKHGSVRGETTGSLGLRCPTKHH